MITVQIILKIDLDILEHEKFKFQIMMKSLDRFYGCVGGLGLKNTELEDIALLRISN